MSKQNKAVAKRNYQDVRQLIESKGMQDQLKKALPGVMKLDQLIRVSLTVIRTNSKLLECSQQSLLGCVMGCAQLGLSPEPYLGQAYFVPFWNKKLRSFEATFMPGYRGYITLARRSGKVSNLSAQMVYQNDDFTVRWGLVDVLDHAPAESNRGDYRGAWTVFRYRDNEPPTFDYMSLVDIERIKEKTKSRNKQGETVGPWITDFAEMAKKTVIRRHIKLVPLATEDNRLAMAAHAENLALTGSQPGFFLPEPEPIEILPIAEDDEESTGDPQYVPDALAIFVDVMGDIVGDPFMDEFMGLCASSNNTTVEGAKAEALKDPEPFKKAFLIWKDRKVAECPESSDDPAPEMPEAFFIAKWKNLKAKNFKKFVTDNADVFNDIKGTWPAAYNKARNKYLSVVKEPWPLDVKAPQEDAPVEIQRVDENDVGLYRPGDEKMELVAGKMNGTAGDDKGDVAKSQGAAPQAQNGRKLHDTEEWGQMMILAKKYPKQFLFATKGKDPVDLAGVVAIIMRIENAMEGEEDQMGIPDGS